MKLTELLNNQKVTLNIQWGEQEIAFPSEVVGVADDGVIVKAIIYNNKPLDINITPSTKVVCSLFAENLTTNKRVSWKNIELRTLDNNGEMVHFIRTSGFNSLSNDDDRRRDNRLKIQKKAQIYNEKTQTFVDIIIFDISDVGVSFYAPTSYVPATNRLNILFSDYVGEHAFSMRIDCEIVRSKQAVGTMFYGCRTMENNKDFLMYGCLKRLEKKKLATGGITIV